MDIIIPHPRKSCSEHGIWAGMKHRCNNPNSRLYKHYGGRGIKVCDRWALFENFYIDMGPRPSKQHSLDRIDNDGDYEPGNCRWATADIQSNNRRGAYANFTGSGVITRRKHKNKTGYVGVYEQNGKYRAGLNISLGIFDTKEEAATAYEEARKKLGI